MQNPSQRPLAVGLNLIYLTTSSGGAGTYARELIRALLAVEPDTRITAFVNPEAPASLKEAAWAEPVEWVELQVDMTSGRPHTMVARMGAQWAAIPWLAARRGIDVVHGLANLTPLVAPRVTTVVTLLDLIWLSFPNTMTRTATLAMKGTAIPSAKQADRVIAISTAARDEMVERIHLKPEKVDITPLGIRQDPTVAPAPEDELRRKFELGEAPVVLCVAQKREHKNLTGLVRALAQLEDQSAILVVPGSPTPHEEELRALATELGVAARLRLPAWLENEELEGLYRLASCFVLPSFEEGFGLPLLEAMRRDVPVATSNVSSMPEVAGDAALLFDPHQPAAIARAVDRLMSDRELAADLVRRGHARCDEFTWERTARLTLSSYRRAIDGRGG